MEARAREPRSRRQPLLRAQVGAASAGAAAAPAGVGRVPSTMLDAHLCQRPNFILDKTDFLNDCWPRNLGYLAGELGYLAGEKGERW